MPAGARALCLAISIACGCIVWGVLISLPPPFYPTEAERKGATASQVNSIDKSIWSNRGYFPFEMYSLSKHIMDILFVYSMDSCLELLIWLHSFLLRCAEYMVPR